MRRVLGVLTVCLVIGSSAIASPLTQVLHLSSSNVELVAQVPLRGASAFGAAGGHFSTRTVAGVTRTFFYVTGTTSGLSVFDATDPFTPVVVGDLALPHWENEDVDLAGDTLLISADGSFGAALFVIDISLPTAPRLRATYKFQDNSATWGTGKPGHIANCILECRYAYVTGARSGYVGIVDLGDGTDPSFQPALAGVFRPEAGASNPNGGPFRNNGITHDVNVDSSGLVWETGSGGVSVYSIDPAQGGSATDPVRVASNSGVGLDTLILHNSLRPQSGNYVFVTEEDYFHPNANCEGSGRFEIYSFDGATITPVSTWRLSDPDYSYQVQDATAGYSCSSHWFDYRRNDASSSEELVAIGHYQQGVRFLDVTNKNSIQEVGWWRAPDAMASAAYFHPTDSSIVYAVDYQRGVDVLHMCEGPCPSGGGLMAGVTLHQLSEPNVWMKPSKAWGYACPVVRTRS
ncbi:MAG: LVIVD repeat-containing protein [Actinomycetota bacterium]